MPSIDGVGAIASHAVRLQEVGVSLVHAPKARPSEMRGPLARGPRLVERQARMVTGPCLRKGLVGFGRTKKQGLEGDLTVVKLGVSGGTRYLSSRSETYDELLQN